MYLWMKPLHVVAVIAFLANVTTGLFWRAHAARVASVDAPGPPTGP